MVFQRFGANVKIVHFIGAKKPWQYTINLETGKVIHDHGIISVTSSERFVQQWWDIYNEIAAHRITVSHVTFISIISNADCVHSHCCNPNTGVYYCEWRHQGDETGRGGGENDA